MNNTKHTPTPWRIGRSIPTAVVGTDEAGNDALIVAMLGNPCETRNFEQRKVDAAFIVRAVNSHAALVNALTLLAEKVAADGYFQCQDELLHARAALALAKD